jgi:hypothetical protein
MPIRKPQQSLKDWTKQDWTGQTARADSPLTLALVRAHRWREAIEQGAVKSVDDLAKKAESMGAKL